MEKSRELETAISAAKNAGRILLENLETHKVVKVKGVQNACTDADLESERAIIDAIKSEFPEHGIVSEEAGTIGKKSEFTWLVDPLDGTRNYTGKIPIFSVSIALAKKQKILLGVVHDPSAKRTYFAEKGKGAFLEGKRIAVSGTRKINEAMIYLDHGKPDEKGKKEFDRIQTAAWRIRNFGAGSLGLCYVAQGGYDAYIGGRNTKIVDIAAASIIAEEAGAEISGRKGSPANLFENRAIVACNKFLHKEILKILQ